jgi:hypothetical protein
MTIRLHDRDIIRLEMNEIQTNKLSFNTDIAGLFQFQRIGRYGKVSMTRFPSRFSGIPPNARAMKQRT